MSLLGDLAKQALGSVLGGQTQGGNTSPLLQIATSLLQQAGGVDGLVAKFQQAGLGDKIASWIGTGHNLPITAEQVKEVLGGHLNQVAQQTGQSTNEVAGGLAQILPGLIDHITPGGQVPDGAAVEKMLAGLIESGGLAKLLGTTTPS
jgi:uncharacterized protein YidB (DUF937 family)